MAEAHLSRERDRDVRATHRMDSVPDFLGAKKQPRRRAAGPAGMVACLRFYLRRRRRRARPSRPNAARARVEGSGTAFAGAIRWLETA